MRPNSLTHGGSVWHANGMSELLIRTNHLLLAVERTFSEQDNVSGKAMIFGSFPVRATA